jgi:basic membrane lipoprotein Med (substrate-binding protein (PBP1-ABC) superfamily)
MNRKLWGIFAGTCVFAMWALQASGQTSEVKEKPPMYSYVSNWSIPRAQWGEMEKANAADQKILDQALASGTIVGYGNDVNLVHEADGATHDDWWSAMSLAGLINVLDQFYKTGTATSPVLASATKHWDSVYVSRYYNWHPGTWKDGYTHVSSYKLKADAPDDAVDTLSKGLVVPLMEKMIADGTLHEYEIDTEAIHTDAPGTFLIVYIAANADGLDKVNAAIRQALKSNPLSGPAFGSMVESSAHRDYLVRTNATYK